MHPPSVLFQGESSPVVIPVCDHYAGSEKLMRKSMALQQQLGPVFDITFDCEDGAAQGNEEVHADMLGRMLASEDNRFGRIGARVHDISTGFFARDVEIILGHAAHQLAYLVIPKIESAAELTEAISFVNQRAEKYGRSRGGSRLPIHVLIETHGALADVRSIAAMEQVECLSFGIMDFVSAHYGAIPGDAMKSPAQFTHPLLVRAKLEIAAACHAHGKTPSHNVTTEIHDAAVVARDACSAATEFGYTRMWSIHPTQIEPILKSFSPHGTEIDDAVAILAQAKSAQWGPIQYKGKLHDRASYRYYWYVLRRAQSSGLSLPEAASSIL